MDDMALEVLALVDLELLVLGVDEDGEICFWTTDDSVDWRDVLQDAFSS